MKRRLFSIILGVVLTMSMLCQSAFAADYTATITGSEAGKTFSAYKVLDVTLSGANYAYTINSNFQDFMDGIAAADTDTSGAVSDEEAYAYIASLTDPDDLKAFANDAVHYALKTPVTPKKTQTVATGDTALTMDLDAAGPGYYVFYGHGGSANTVAAMIGTTDKTVTFGVKAEYQTIENHVVKDADEADSEYGKAKDGDIGSTKTFKIETAVPDTTGYTTANGYVLNVNDTIEGGLTPDISSIAVTLNGNTLTAGTDYTVSHSAIAAGDDTDIQIMFKPSITLVDGDGNGIHDHDGEVIVITFNADINSEANIGALPNQNWATLEYSTAPTAPTTTESSADTYTNVYTFATNIFKYATNGAIVPLENAEFILLNEDGSKYYTYDGNTVTWVTYTNDGDVAANGKVKTNTTGEAIFLGIDAGKYQIKEITAPNGYNKLTSTVEVEIKPAYNSAGDYDNTNSSVIVNGTAITGTLNPARVTVPIVQEFIDIENKSGAQLPETGGIGRVIFYGFGLIAMAGVATVLIRRRKATEDCE